LNKFDDQNSSRTSFGINSPLEKISSPIKKGVPGFLPEILARNNGSIANAFGDVSFDYVKDLLKEQRKSTIMKAKKMTNRSNTQSDEEEGENLL